jgi:hypothetical protein
MPKQHSRPSPPPIEPLAGLVAGLGRAQLYGLNRSEIS